VPVQKLPLPPGGGWGELSKTSSTIRIAIPIGAGGYMSLSLGVTHFLTRRPNPVADRKPFRDVSYDREFTVVALKKTLPSDLDKRLTQWFVRRTCHLGRGRPRDLLQHEVRISPTLSDSSFEIAAEPGKVAVDLHCRVLPTMISIFLSASFSIVGTRNTIRTIPSSGVG
jgi:hypothetical protein